MYNHLISLTWVSYTMDLQRSDQADISQFYNGYTRTASDLQGIIQYYCTTVFYNTASHITKGEGCTKHPHEIHNTFTTSVVFCNTNLETTGVRDKTIHLLLHRIPRHADLEVISRPNAISSTHRAAGGSERRRMSD